VPFISRSNSGPFFLVFSAGLFSAALQSVYFREYLSVFSGNELSIGMIFAVWLLAAGAGSMAAARLTRTRGPAINGPKAACALTACAVAGMLAIRASRLVFAPGQLLGPLEMAGVLAASELPFALVNGFVLGTLLSSPAKPHRLYAWENAGAFIGALAVYACVLLYARNSLIVVVAMVPLTLVCVRKAWLAGACVAAAALLLVFDHASVQWKYIVPVHRVVYGHEGEIVPLVAGSDTTFLQNGAVYKSSMQRPALEQAVHIPMGERPQAKRTLVIFDRGHHAELAKYPGLVIDEIETEPAFASPRSRIVSPETFSPKQHYDVIFVGSGMPRSAASNRLYTLSFFQHAQSLLSDSGIVTFSLPFSENYLSPAETKLYDALYATLGAVFQNVLVFPGEGYTFMASNASLNSSWKVGAATDYLASTIIPGMSEERLRDANKKPANAFINTKERPITLFLGLQTWLELFKNSVAILAAILFACCAAALWFLPKTRPALSVATSGLSIGMYSVCLLLMYQATYGALYSRVSLLLVALTAGFALGALIKKFPFSDIAIGLYCAGSLALLWAIPCPPAFLFYFLHAGIGVLGGAQIVSRSGTGLGALYAADLFGGALGMALCSTLLVPLFGILPVAGGIGGMKIVVELVNLTKRNKK
jgi:hypothetical protein